MKNFTRILLVLVVVLLAASALAQTATTSTTLSAAISDSKVQQIVVASATNINAPTVSHSGSKLYVDREVLDVTAVNGTTITVVRGATGTLGMPHASGATVYVDYSSLQGNSGPFKQHGPRFGGCTAGNENYLPALFTAPPYGGFGQGYIGDCFGSVWQYDMNLPLYKFTVAPQAQRSAVTPSAGNANSIVAQAGGASSNASNAGGAGGAATFNAGAGGAGASTGTAGAGGALNLASGAGGAAAGAGGVGGAGGAVTIAGGVSGGSITSGAGGSVAINGGASANGSTAAGNGGNVTLKGGNVGTGGTGVVGKVQVAGAADPTKLFIFDPSGNSTGIALTFAGAATAARTATFPDASITVGSASERACGTTTTCAATVTNNVIVAYGSAALSSGTPSTASITGLPFTSQSTFWCTATPEGTTAAVAAGGMAINKTSGSAMTLTGPNTVTTVIDYVCHGT